MVATARHASASLGGGQVLSETRLASARGGEASSSTRALTQTSAGGGGSGGRPSSAPSPLGATRRTNAAAAAVAIAAASSLSSKQTHTQPPRAKPRKLLSVQEKRAAGLVEERDGAAPARPRRPRPDSAPATGKALGGAKPAPFGVPKARVVALELAMRVALRAVHSAACSSKVRLTEEFTKMDDGGGEVTFLAFRGVWAELGVDMTESEARATCRAHGGGRSGEHLPYKNFVDRMVRGAARVQADGLVCRGYPVTDADFRKKILYPRCRKGVYAPSDFDLELADRSTTEPDAALELEFVYGYDGVTNTAPNLFFTGGGVVETKNEDKDGDGAGAGGGGEGGGGAGLLAYYTAAVGVVYDRRNDSQRHFLGHTKDICCMTMCAAVVDVGGVTYPALTLAATGQRKAVEDLDTDEVERPFVAIWDVRTCCEVARVSLDPSARAAVAVAFSPDGALLVTVGCDNQHTVTLWDWRAPGVGDAGGSGGRPVGWVGQGGGYTERPVGVFGAKWDPHARRGHERFCTWGMKHLKQWTCDPGTGRWSAQSMSFGAFGVDNVLSCEFLRPSVPPGGEAAAGAVVTGMPDGTLLVWRNSKAVRRVLAHGRGPRTIQADGTMAWGGGVRALRLRADGLTLLSGGADGCVMLWDASRNKIGDLMTAPLHLKSATIGPGPAPAIRALDCMPGSDIFAVGTDQCDVWEVGAAPEVILKGHSADLYALCWHPAKPGVFVSAAESGRVFVWDAEGTSLMRHGRAGCAARAVAVSHSALGGSTAAVPDPTAAAERSHHIAVGGRGGELVVLDEYTFRPVFRDRPCKSGVEDVKYSPDDTRLAVASRDQVVDVYVVRGRKQAYTHAHRCVGHSASVRHLDWSADSQTIATDGADYELLYWDALTGKQQSHNQQNTAWASWTRVLGFPVMGVWVPGSDGTDVNAVDRSADGRYLVTADDYGTVKLLAYPAVVEGSGHRTYLGHASFVCNVRFSPDPPGPGRLDHPGGADPASAPAGRNADEGGDRIEAEDRGDFSLDGSRQRSVIQPMSKVPAPPRRVITAGGRDRSIFQYRVVPVAPPPPRPRTPELEWLPLDAAGKSYGWRRSDQPPAPC